ncbi:hypothetical protein [Flavobacterium cheniae]|uniref:Uncharacterized protein n=1 Tax=Flavobacterium cheniae TaxID=295428 RepID=A0A562KSF4_9FLAO|nr:hypothetical protein [Flavobacterium cheniae]TDR25465.1 hypothetical protein C8D80_0238 [Flavobacterium cheniae]TWH98348.1 hypothetical protein IP97_00297 [Flavobacterium cheniae]
MTIGEGKVVWLFFENITEYLFSLFSKKIKNQVEIIDELESKLKFEFDISISDLMENNSIKIQNAIQKIEVYFLDEIIESIYFCVKSKARSRVINKLKSIKNLDSKLLDLIQIADNKSSKLCLSRNNIKNSLQHSLRN